MSLEKSWSSSVWLASALGMVVASVLTGCAGASGSSPQKKVAVMKVDAPVTEPLFLRDTEDLIARVEGEDRIAKIKPKVVGEALPTRAKTILSKKYKDAGKNVALEPTGRNLIYLPQPKLNRIAVIDRTTLKQVDSFKPIPSPVWVSASAGSEVLFALSRDGKTVSGVNLKTNDLIPSALIEKTMGGKEAELEGAERSLSPAFWAMGKEGVGFYEGHDVPIEKVDEIKVKARTLAADIVKDSRAYVGVKGTDRLVALQLHPATDKIYVTAKRTLPEPVEYITVDERRIFAATESKLYVFRAENFQSMQSFDVLKIINYRRPLKQEALKEAKLSGIVTNPESANVYLTLDKEPYIISIAKPTAP